MHPVDILFYGHQTVIQSIEGVADSDWDIPGACGVWSVHQIIAHLSSFEHVLIEILQTLLEKNAPTPTMNLFFQEGSANFNDNQVALRQDQTVKETWNEYETAYQKSFELFKQIPDDLHRQTGLLTWYGDTYDLEDFLIYSFYGHKREHTAQINAFKDFLSQEETTDPYA
jgi:uncharacterized damage-inducible protein DinB